MRNPSVGVKWNHIISFMISFGMASSLWGQPETNPNNQKEKYVNRLAKESSPYLLQHKNNPVDWYPWGQEAFERAKELDRPIFLSLIHISEPTRPY